MLEQSEIERELLRFMRAELLEEQAEVASESELAALGVDSFALLELVMHLERTFGVRLEPRALTREVTRTVATLANEVARVAAVSA